MIQAYHPRMYASEVRGQRKRSLPTWALAMIPILVGILVGGAAVAALSGYGHLGVSQPLRTFLELTSVSDTRNGSSYLYAFSVAVIAPNLTASDLSFQVKSGAGSLVPFSVVEIDSPAGKTLAVFNGTTSTWVTGGTSSVVVNDTVMVVAPHSLVGNSLVVLVLGPLGGQLWQNIA